MRSTYRKYFILVLLTLVFVAPGLSAYIVFNHTTWLSAAKTNKGTLLSPPMLFADSGMESKWRLVLWSPASCDAVCQQQLDKLARVRLALGRRLYQVDQWLVLGAAAPQLSEALANLLHDQAIQVLRLPSDKLARQVGLPIDSELFIMNPDDYLVLAYQATSKPGDIYHDIKRLLNVKE